MVRRVWTLALVHAKPNVETRAHLLAKDHVVVNVSRVALAHVRAIAKPRALPHVEEMHQYTVVHVRDLAKVDV